MKASEIIQKLLEITQKEGRDLEVVTDYTDGFHDYYHPREPDFCGIWDIEVKPRDLDGEKEPVIVLD